MNGVKVYKITFAIVLLFVLQSCVIATGRISTEYVKRGEGEKIEFLENKVNARVKWKKNIGTSVLKSSAYLIGGSSPAIRPDGRIYFQDQRNIFIMDASTGDILDKCERLHDGGRGGVAVLDGGDAETGKMIFPLVNLLGVARIVLFFNDKTGKCEIKGGGLGYDKIEEWLAFYHNNEIIRIEEHILNMYSIRSYDSSASYNPFRSVFNWRINNKYMPDFYSAEVYDNSLIILYSKWGVLRIEAYDLSSGNLLWENEFEARKSGSEYLYKLTGFYGLTELKKLKEIFILEFSDIAVESGQIAGRVISIDPKNGKINWQMPDIVRIYTKEVGEGDNLIYLSKKNQPGIFYGLDQKTGEEKFKSQLKEYNYYSGLIPTHDKIFYPSGIVKSNLFQYNAFGAIDKKTGKQLWITNLENQIAIPHYEDGVLYFGNKPDFYKNLTSGTKLKYVHDIVPYERKDIPKFLSKTAFAVDASTGKVLWKIKLEGGDEAYIEKLFVKDNMVFIKSLSGWLYAIEWEKP